MRPPASATRAADAIAFTAFLVIPLAVCPALWDQFVTVKWYALEALAALWLLAEAAAGSSGMPRFLRENVLLAALAGALALASIFRAGAPAAVAPLVERGSAAALVLCAYWSARRGNGMLRAARLATAVALAVVTAVGCVQLLGRDPLAALTAGDHRGSTFGNANMAAQYAALAVLLLIASARPRARARAAADAAVAAAAAVWLVFLGTRSVLLALGAAGAALALAGGVRTRMRAALVAAGCAVAVAAAGWAAVRLFDPALRAHKAESAEHRLHVWSDTLRMLRDHPLGVGAGNFEDAYRPYQATGSGFVDERQVYRHPHDEYLRIAAEEGLPQLAVLAALFARLALALRRRWGAAEPEVRRLIAAWTAFLLVEGLFQFPLALAFPVLALALLLGLAFATAEDRPAVPRRSPAAAWRLGAVAAAVLLGVGAWRVALSERLFVAARTDVAAQERACGLDARNLPACVMAAWLHGASGDLPGGRALLVRVLERAPHYPPAAKLLAQQAAVAGDHEAACVYMAAYEALFRGESTLHADYLRQCDERARQAAAARVPGAFYARFPLAGEDAR